MLVLKQLPLGVLTSRLARLLLPHFVDLSIHRQNALPTITRVALWNAFRMIKDRPFIITDLTSRANRHMLAHARAASITSNL